MIEVSQNVDAVTADTLFDGEVCCHQFKNGYRFSVDAVLAAHFHAPSRGEKVLDLGAGSGVIGLIMMYRWRQRIALLRALELQPELCDLANHNYVGNLLDESCRCHHGDVKQILSIFAPESFSLVVCNPPFYRLDTGRQSVDTQAKIARHQVTADISEFARGAAAVLKNGGSAVFIYPAGQFTELAAALAAVRLEIKDLQFVHSYPDDHGKARLVLVRCVKNGGLGVTVREPFYIYGEKNGEYSENMKLLFSP